MISLILHAAVRTRRGFQWSLKVGSETTEYCNHWMKAQSNPKKTEPIPWCGSSLVQVGHDGRFRQTLAFVGCAVCSSFQWDKGNGYELLNLTRYPGEPLLHSA